MSQNSENADQLLPLARLANEANAVAAAVAAANQKQNANQEQNEDHLD